MSFTLRIRFSGVCLFVPRRNTSNLMRMHVLMPDLLSGNHGRHVPVLKFDTAHLRPGQPGKDGITASRDIAGKSLTIGNAEASDFICPQIVKLREATGQDVPSNLLQPSPGTASLGARVTLADGRMTLVARGKCWRWVSGEAQRMTHVAQWVITMGGEDLRLRLDPLGNGLAIQLPPLYPIVEQGQSGFLDLSVHHLTPEDLAPIPPPPPPPPAPGDRAPHFGAYYNLYNPVPVPHHPLFAGDTCNLPDNPCDEETEMGSSAFNCMLGSGA